MDWQIRDASERDTERLALIGSATFLESFAGTVDGQAILDHCREEQSTAAYAKLLGSGAKAWLAETTQGQSPVGYAIMATPSLPKEITGMHDLELKRIYSFSRFHGTGLGSVLMRAAVEEARSQAAARLLLGVYGENHRAIQFYQKHGFVHLGQRQFRVGNRSFDDIVLAKDLGV